MDTTLTATNESQEKQRLHEAIRQKQEEFENLTKKTEDLRWNLLEIKKLYMERIGRLYLDMDRIDMEIGIFREIEKHVETGKTIEEAKQIVADEQILRQKRVIEEKQRLEEEVTIIANKQQLTKPDLTKIKQLFRTLIMKYHPDLTQDKQEKKYREQMMIQINKAYEENDIEWLTRIQEEQMVDDFKNATIEFLQKKLTEYFDVIATLTKEYKLLLGSEWYRWRKKLIKATREKRDGFKDLETQLKETIKMKSAVLADLKHLYEEI